MLRKAGWLARLLLQRWSRDESLRVRAHHLERPGSDGCFDDIGGVQDGRAGKADTPFHRARFCVSFFPEYMAVTWDLEICRSSR